MSRGPLNTVGNSPEGYVDDGHEVFGRHEAHVVRVEAGAQLGQQGGDVQVDGLGVQRRVRHLDEIRDEARVVGWYWPQVQPDGRAHHGAADRATRQRDQHGPPFDSHL